MREVTLESFFDAATRVKRLENDYNLCIHGSQNIQDIDALRLDCSKVILNHADDFRRVGSDFYQQSRLSLINVSKAKIVQEKAQYSLAQRIGFRVGGLVKRGSFSTRGEAGLKAAKKMEKVFKASECRAFYERDTTVHNFAKISNLDSNNDFVSKIDTFYKAAGNDNFKQFLSQNICNVDPYGKIDDTPFRRMNVAPYETIISSLNKIDHADGSRLSDSFLTELIKKDLGASVLMRNERSDLIVAMNDADFISTYHRLKTFANSDGNSFNILREEGYNIHDFLAITPFAQGWLSALRVNPNLRPDQLDYITAF